MSKLKEGIEEGSQMLALSVNDKGRKNKKKGQIVKDKDKVKLYFYKKRNMLV